MNSFLTISAIIFTSIAMQGQEASLPSSLTIATKEGLQKLEDKKQDDIIRYSKNNEPKQDVTANNDNVQNDFYELYLDDNNNRYYNTYHYNTIDPAITAMPAPGPNLNYQLIDPCSSGNYDKVVKQ
jgi:hypothetical protein